MQTIARDDLERVLGAQNTDTTTLGPLSSTSSTSDATLCTQAAATIANRQYPDTRPLGLAIPGTTDTNADARQQAAQRNRDTMCIGPAGGGAGGFR
jgi:hypothetical protein